MYKKGKQAIAARSSVSVSIVSYQLFHILRDSIYDLMSILPSCLHIYTSLGKLHIYCVDFALIAKSSSEIRLVLTNEDTSIIDRILNTIESDPLKCCSITLHSTLDESSYKHYLTRCTVGDNKVIFAESIA